MLADDIEAQQKLRSQMLTPNKRLRRSPGTALRSPSSASSSPCTVSLLQCQCSCMASMRRWLSVGFYASAGLDWEEA